MANAESAAFASPDTPGYLERHYTVAELAKAWHISQRKIRERFREESGVIRWGPAKLVKGRKRTHLSLRIPASVAERVYREMVGKG